jgi:hypothetical protein
MAERTCPTCRNRETPSSIWRRVPGLVGGFVRYAEQTRRSAVPAEIIRQLFLEPPSIAGGRRRDITSAMRHVTSENRRHKALKVTDSRRVIRGNVPLPLTKGIVTPGNGVTTVIRFPRECDHPPGRPTSDNSRSRIRLRAPGQGLRPGEPGLIYRGAIRFTIVGANFPRRYRPGGRP